MPDDPNSDVYLPRERTHMERAASAPMDALRAENDQLRCYISSLESEDSPLVYVAKAGVKAGMDLRPGARLLLLNPEDGEHKEIRIQKIDPFGAEEVDQLRKALSDLFAAARNALSDIRPRSPVRKPLEEALERAKRATQPDA